MTCFTVYRHKNGISLNGREYLLDQDGRVQHFTSTDEVLKSLNIESVAALEEQGVYIEEETDDTAEPVITVILPSGS